MMLACFIFLDMCEMIIGKRVSYLVCKHHIDMATKNVRRISIPLNSAYLISFAKNLPEAEYEEFLSDTAHG